MEAPATQSDWCPGEKGAWRRWRDFERRLDRYARDRDYPAIAGTSRLSPHLHFGEISPRVLWSALAERTGSGPAAFRRELAWRDHGANLLDPMANCPDRNGRAAFDKLHWRGDAAADRDFLAWTRGRTGYPIVDAGMRELWKSGWMHNRVRMIAASFLVKHLLIDWRRGERWFWDTLLDADLGSNAMNWQYVAGTGQGDGITDPRRLPPTGLELRDSVRIEPQQMARGFCVPRSDRPLTRLVRTDAGTAACIGPVRTKLYCRFRVPGLNATFGEDVRQ